MSVHSIASTCRHCLTVGVASAHDADRVEPAGRVGPGRLYARWVRDFPCSRQPGPHRRVFDIVTRADGSSELYDPTTAKWTSAGLPTYPDSRMSGFGASGADNKSLRYDIDTATLLHDGRVLLTIRPGALLFDPAGAP